jgi:hypothetical protein
MKRAPALLILVAASIPSAFGQHATPLQSPVIVKRLHLTSQTGSLGSVEAPVALFTPDHDGLYRATIFIQVTGEPAAFCTEAFCAQAAISYGGHATTVGAAFQDNVVQPFLGVAGQPVGYYTTSAGTTPGVYDLAIVIEEL